MPIKVIDFLEILEDVLQIRAIKRYSSNTLGEMDNTEADTKKLEDWIQFKPKVKLRTGIKYFVNWFREYYKI